MKKLTRIKLTERIFDLISCECKYEVPPLWPLIKFIQNNYEDGNIKGEIKNETIIIPQRRKH